MSTEDTALPLTKQDIAVMRAAEAVYFRRDYDGASYLKLTLKGSWDAKAPRIYTATEQRLFPHTSSTSGDRYFKIAATSIVGSYADAGVSTEHAVCKHEIRWPDNNPEWQTILRALKPGDLPRLSWRAGNNYPLITEAGLHRDELRLALHREKNSPVFLIDAVVAADNTASMIQL